MTDRKQRLLPAVQKPARYTGGEWGEVQKNKDEIHIRVAFCFPDTYEIGMSNLGMRILYGVMNNQPDVWCERVFAPWGDMEAALRREAIPLWALESQDPVKDFDMIAFTIGYEMAYSNILNMLDLAGIPLHAKDRHEHGFCRWRLCLQPGAPGGFHRLFLHRRGRGHHGGDRLPV